MFQICSIRSKYVPKMFHPFQICSNISKYVPNMFQHLQICSKYVQTIFKRFSTDLQIILKHNFKKHNLSIRRKISQSIRGTENPEAMKHTWHRGPEYWIHRRKAALKVRKSCSFGRKPSKIVEIPRKNGAESEEINKSGALCCTEWSWNDALLGTNSIKFVQESIETVLGGLLYTIQPSIFD